MYNVVFISAVRPSASAIRIHTVRFITGGSKEALGSSLCTLTPIYIWDLVGRCMHVAG